jgi:outer membrane protein OmpA-like peptidoglycan-associated protein
MKHPVYLILLSVFWIAQAHAECEKAAEQYRQAVLPETALTECIRLLESSVKDCNSFSAYFELGKAYAKNNNLTDSVAALENAAGVGNDTEKVQAWWLLAKVYKKFDRMEDAVARYRMAFKFIDARHLPRNNDMEKELMQIEQGRAGSIVMAGQIKSGLQKSMAGQKAIGIEVAPFLDIRVHFDYNDSNLTSEGQKQAEQLSQALMDPDFQKFRFTLLGHTDLRGTDEYNNVLSLRRAEAVRNYILGHSRIQPDRIKAQGKGRQEALYHESTESAHALNRRVEVQINPLP